MTRRPPSMDRQLHRQLADRGWAYVRRANSGHHIYAHPRAPRLLVVSCSPGDYRETANTLARAARLTDGRECNPTRRKQ